MFAPEDSKVLQITRAKRNHGQNTNETLSSSKKTRNQELISDTYHKVRQIDIECMPQILAKELTTHLEVDGEEVTNIEVDVDLTSQLTDEESNSSQSIKTNLGNVNKTNEGTNLNYKPDVQATFLLDKDLEGKSSHAVGALTFDTKSIGAIGKECKKGNSSEIINLEVREAIDGVSNTIATDVFDAKMVPPICQSTETNKSLGKVVKKPIVNIRKEQFLNAKIILEKIAKNAAHDIHERNEEDLKIYEAAAMDYEVTPIKSSNPTISSISNNKQKSSTKSSSNEENSATKLFLKVKDINTLTKVERSAKDMNLNVKDNASLSKDPKSAKATNLKVNGTISKDQKTTKDSNLKFKNNLSFSKDKDSTKELNSRVKDNVYLSVKDSKSANELNLKVKNKVSLSKDQNSNKAFNARVKDNESLSEAQKSVKKVNLKVKDNVTLSRDQKSTKDFNLKVKEKLSKNNKSNNESNLSGADKAYDAITVVKVPPMQSLNTTIDLTSEENPTKLSGTSTKLGKTSTVNEKEKLASEKRFGIVSTRKDCENKKTNEKKYSTLLYGELPKTLRNMRKRYNRAVEMLERTRKKGSKTSDDIFNLKRYEAYIEWYEKKRRELNKKKENKSNNDSKDEEKSIPVIIDVKRVDAGKIDKKDTTFDLPKHTVQAKTFGVSHQAPQVETRFGVIPNQVGQYNNTGWTLHPQSYMGAFQMPHVQADMSQFNQNRWPISNYNYDHAVTNIPPYASNMNCNSTLSFVQNESVSNNQYRGQMFGNITAPTANNYPWYQQTTNNVAPPHLLVGAEPSPVSPVSFASSRSVNIMPNTQSSNTTNDTSSMSKIKVAIIDIRNPKARIPDDQWEPIEEKLLLALVNEINNNEMHDIFTAFNGFKWENGVKVIECDNRKAVNFLKENIRSLGQLTAFLEVLPSEMILDRKVVCVIIPPPIPNTEMLLKLFQKQNQNLKSDSWIILNTQKISDYVKIDIEVSSESLELIRGSNDMLKFGLTNYRVTYSAAKEAGNNNLRWH